tara:strand:+ start:2031 stop:2726 length:696 start_codon:yes stop_codon:yes gene_type:complete
MEIAKILIMSISLIILTLNEIEGVKIMIPKVKQEWADEIVLVDGGSTDGTIEEVKRLGLQIIHQKTKGHGGAILDGVKGTSSDTIVIWSPDGNHEVEEIPRLIEKIKEGYDQVIISRFGKGSVNLDAGILETFGNKMFTAIVNILFGGNLTDILNESRIITRKAFMELNFDAFDMTSTQQMSIRGLKRKQKITEIVGNEGKRIGGTRKMRPFYVGKLLSEQIIKEFIFWKR